MTVCIGSLYNWGAPVCFETQHLTTTTVEVEHTTEKSYMKSTTNCNILSASNTRKLFSISLNATKWEFFEGWGQLWKMLYVKVGHEIPHSKSVKSVFSNFYQYAQGTPKYKDIGT